MSKAAPEQTEQDKNVERYKVKRLIKMLESARGVGTSVISIYCPPKDQVARVVNMLNIEMGTASNIKSHTNKLSVQTAITSALGRLKLINRIPPNGMLLYCGTVLNEENKEKKMVLDIEPFKPVSRSLYLCDNKFHTEELHRMLDSDDKYGFIVVDGNGAYFAEVCGNVKTKLAYFTVELPKKHGRGGQSKNRFARIRMEKRHNYLRKVCEQACQCYISNDRPTVAGLVLAGSADFKELLYQTDMLDQRLKAVVVKVVDVAHPGEVGLNQAIDLAADSLGNVKIVHEKKLVQKFFDEIATDSQQFCFGLQDTMKCLLMGAIKTIIVYEDLDASRYEVTKPGKEDEDPEVLFLTPKQAAEANLHKSEGQNAANTVEELQLVDWLAQNYQKFGCVLEIITNKSQEGTQFVRGFGGIGGLLQYKVDLMSLQDMEAVGAQDGDGEGGEDFDIDDDFM